MAALFWKNPSRPLSGKKHQNRKTKTGDKYPLWSVGNAYPRIEARRKKTTKMARSAPDAKEQTRKATRCTCFMYRAGYEEFVVGTFWKRSLLWGLSPWPYAYRVHALPAELRRPCSKVYRRRSPGSRAYSKPSSGFAKGIVSLLQHRKATAKKTVISES